MFFHFTDDLKVGVAIIDQQHGKLIQLINDFHEAMKERKAKEIAPKIIGELLKYTREHFRDEMQLQDKHGYPDRANHLKMHDGFVQKVADFERDLNNGKLTLSLELANFLKDWLWRHIEGEDKKKLGPFLNAKGVH